MVKKKEKALIGWREIIDLPDWGIRGLKAKIDTGAQSSALHVEDIEELPNNILEFYVVLSQKKNRKKVTAKQIKKGRVKSSIGIKTSRWYVETTLKMGKSKRKIILNLVGREGMNYRMLVGRNAVRGQFVVDPGRSFLSAPLKKRRKKRRKTKSK